MSIYQRGKNKTWWIQFTDQNGQRIQKSAGTKVKQEAQELHDRLKFETWRVKSLGAKPAYTWQEAVIRWITEQGNKKSLDTDKFKLRWLDQHLNNTKLNEITKDKIDQIKAAKKQTGVSDTTVNRTLELIRSILNRAYKEWEWLDSVPHIRLYAKPLPAIRWITGIEAERLYQELPEHLLAMVRFSLSTGLRESNVTGLQWGQIDMQRRCAWINPDQAKAKKAIAVPLNTDALAVIRNQLGKNDTHIFTYKGEPVTRANNHAWRKALVRAGIKNFRWHDLRHTWASWHIQNGTPVHVLKELGGWADLTMVMRYAHLSSDHLHEYAGNVSKDKIAFETNSLQAQKKA